MTIKSCDRWQGLLMFGVFLGGIIASASQLTAQPASFGWIAAAAPGSVVDDALGSTKNVHRYRQLYFAGQFEPGDLQALQEAGIEHVITLRTDGEIDWDEQGLVEDAGMRFTKVPFRGPEELTADVLDSVRAVLRNRGDAPTLLHCASANRVGAVWLAYRVLDEDVPWEHALAEARRIGLRTPEFVDSVQMYTIERQEPAPATQDAEPRDRKSAPQDINAPFLDPQLDVEEFLKRFEVESREVYTARKEILKVLEVRPGESVADIGAGTGLFTRMIAPLAGDEGRVFAVEIAPAFLQYINKSTDRMGIDNVTPVLCSQRSIYLPRNSIDVAFVCDTYHHFTFPQDTLASIAAALKPEGRLIIVDFIREDGISSEWILNHVRAGKAVVRSEIEAAGFTFVDEPAVPGLQENYVLRFRKPDDGR